MGWTYMPKPANVKAYLTDLLTWEIEHRKQTVAEIKIVKLRTAYAAVEIVDKATGQCRVEGSVILLDYRRGDSFDFGYKGVDESMGPRQTECPASILAKLTPTDHEWALAWREACRKRLANPVKPFKVRVGRVEAEPVAAYPRINPAFAKARKMARERADAPVTVAHEPSGKVWQVLAGGGWFEVA